MFHEMLLNVYRISHIWKNDPKIHPRFSELGDWIVPKIGLYLHAISVEDLITGQYSGHKSCFFPHPRGQGYLFSSPIFRTRWCELMLNMTKIGAKPRKVAKIAYIGKKSGKIGKKFGE